MEKLQIENKDGILLHLANSYLDWSFKEAVDALINSNKIANKSSILFNFKKTEALNSYAVSAFVVLFNHLKKKNSVLALCCINESMVKMTLRDTGIIALCSEHIYTTEEEAIKALKKV